MELNSSDEAERYIKMGVTHFALGSELRIERVYWTDKVMIVKAIRSTEMKL